MNKLLASMVILPIILSVNLANATPIYVSGVSSASGWIDTDKTWVDDSNLCWAATASNILAFTGWNGGALLSTASEIFDNYKNYWNNGGSTVEIGTQWWFDGTNSKQGVADWAQLTDTSFTGFYSTALFNSNFESASLFANSDYIDILSNYISGATGLGTVGIGLGVGWYQWDDVNKKWVRNGGHAITVWGIDVDYSILYVTDSDDKANQLDQYVYS
jgi:hypothetical protein